MINANELKSLFSGKIELYQNLNTFLESLFFAKLTLKSEPLLLLGESGYKTFLSEKIISNYEIIDLILGTKINQLLGSSLFLNKKDSILFYLQHFFNMTLDQPENEKRFALFQSKIDSEGRIKNLEEKEKFENFLKSNKKQNEICSNLYEKILNILN